MELYRRQTEKLVNQFHGNEITLDECTAGLAKALADVTQRLEEKLISSLDLPSDLHENSANGFFIGLAELRGQAKTSAGVQTVVSRDSPPARSATSC